VVCLTRKVSPAKLKSFQVSNGSVTRVVLVSVTPPVRDWRRKTMEFRDTIQADLKAAMKAGQKDAVRTLRMLMAVVKNKEIELGRPLGADDAIAVVRSGIKQRKEAIAQFRDGGRVELAEQEEAEAAVLERYLPAALPEQELESIVTRVIADLGASGMKDMGGVMKQVLAEVAGRADGAAVSAKVRERLA